jgi:hypothetical protein
MNKSADPVLNFLFRRTMSQISHELYPRLPLEKVQEFYQPPLAERITRDNAPAPKVR